VPLIVAPIIIADKRDIAARAVWPGVGDGIGLGTPAPEPVVAAVDEIFSEPIYLKRVLEIKEEIEAIIQLLLYPRL